VPSLPDYRYLGSTGVKVSPLCLGTMSFGAQADRATSEALFRQSRAAGINFFDCANVYADGRSEEILGELIADCRDEVVITSKAYFPMGDDPNARGSSRYHLVRAVENSLRRLGTDRLDVFFLHRFDEETALTSTLRALDDLVRQGKVCYLGASNFAAWQVMKAQGISAREGLAPFDVIQPMYNLAKRQAEVELLPMAQAEGLGVTPYSPLGGGLLTGKYGVEARPDEGRLVDNPMYATRYGDDVHYRVAEHFTAFADEHGYDPASLAVAWVAHHPAVTAPIIGARTTEQLDGSLGALDIDMSADLRAAIGELAPTPPPATDRTEERTDHTYGTR
jgi:aryl-alcohol dehydrogenase-like predicted oxidoreductase